MFESISFVLVDRFQIYGTAFSRRNEIRAPLFNRSFRRREVVRAWMTLRFSGSLEIYEIQSKNIIIRIICIAYGSRDGGRDREK